MKHVDELELDTIEFRFKSDIKLWIEMSIDDLSRSRSDPRTRLNVFESSAESDDSKFARKVDKILSPECRKMICRPYDVSLMMVLKSLRILPTSGIIFPLLDLDKIKAGK